MEFIANDIIYTEEITDKKIILDYLKAFDTPIGYSSGNVIDNFSNKEIDIPNALYSDGKFRWTSSILYHFEVYNKKLTDEFIRHVLNSK